MICYFIIQGFFGERGGLGFVGFRGVVGEFGRDGIFGGLGIRVRRYICLINVVNW